MTKKLTLKQQRFCEEYVVDFNATQAAIRAGYSKKTARQTAAENLSKPNIAAEVQRQSEKLTKQAEITAERTLAEVTGLALATMQDYVSVSESGSEAFLDLSDLRPEQWAAVKDIKITERTYGKDNENTVRTTELKLHDKIRPLEMLGRHFGLFPNQHQHTGADGGPIEYREMTDAERARRAAYILRKGMEASQKETKH